MAVTPNSAVAREGGRVAGFRSLTAAGLVGARAIAVRAVDERSAAFYAKFGFRPFSNRGPFTRILRMCEIEGLLRASAAVGECPSKVGFAH